MSDEQVSVTQMWIAPEEYASVSFTDFEKSATELYPDGMFVLMLTSSQKVLSVENVTREDAEQRLMK